MKKLTIKNTQQFQLTNTEAELYRKLLESLKIDFELEFIEEAPTEYRILDLKDRVTTRVYNVVCNFVDPAMTIKDFIENYTIIDFLKCRNFGWKSSSNLRTAINKLGYVW